MPCLLYLTAGAAEMYCGSCLRDNALASALQRRGHDVVLAPIYTPTTTDEKNVSEPHVFFGGVSVFLEQHVPLFRHTPAFLDRLWDSNAVLKLASKRQIKVDPTVLGEMTVSMLKGVDGLPAQGSREDAALARARAALRRRQLCRSRCSSAWPGRCATRCSAPIACTLQGEDLFLEQLPEPWRTESLDLIRRAVADVDVFISVSESYVDVMSRLPRHPARQDPRRAARHQHGRPRAEADAARRRRTRSASSAASRRRRACTCWPTRTGGCARRPGVPPTRLLAGGYMLNEHRAVLRRHRARSCRSWGLADEFHYAGAPDRAGKIALLQEMDVLSMPATYDEPKGFTLIEAMANGVPVVQPRPRRVHRDRPPHRRRPARRPRTIRTRSPTACSRC